MANVESVTNQGNAEQVAVIGSGIAGMLSATRLAEEGYDVTVIESMPELFKGASNYAMHAHFGLEYSSNVPTAEMCMDSSIALVRAFPDLPVYSDKKIQFLLAAEDSSVSVDDFETFLSAMQERYANLADNDQVLGPAENFYRQLDESEYSFMKDGSIAAGFEGQEATFNMGHIRQKLLDRAEQLGVNTMTNTSVIDVSQRGDSGFRLSTQNNYIIRKHDFDQVVNAAGYAALALDGLLGDDTELTGVLKSFHIVRNNGAPMPPFVVGVGPFMVHYPYAQPIYKNSRGQYEDGLSAMNATGAASIIDRATFTAANFPKEWIEMTKTGIVPNESSRRKQVMNYAADKFLKSVVDIDSIALIPAVAATFSKQDANRLQRPATVVQPGWISAILTKATNATVLTEQVVSEVLAHSEQTGRRVAAE